MVSVSLPVLLDSSRIPKLTHVKSVLLGVGHVPILKHALLAITQLSCRKASVLTNVLVQHSTPV